MMEGKARCCDDCRVQNTGDFKKVIDLQKSGLLIYAHTKKAPQDLVSSRKGETYIIQNKSLHDIKRPQYVGELCQYKTKCFQCKRIVGKVRDLLDEFESIRANQVVGVCEYCKKSNTTRKCPRCEFIVNKFLANKTSQSDERQQRFKIWLRHVKSLLQTLIIGDLCQHKIHQDKATKTELENLLKQLKEPLTIQEKSVKMFPECEDKATFDYFQESKDMIEEVLIKLKSQDTQRPYFSDDSLYPSPSRSMCICKYFMDKKFDDSLSLDVVAKASVNPLMITKTTETKKDVLAPELEESISHIKSKSGKKTLSERIHHVKNNKARSEKSLVETQMSKDKHEPQRTQQSRKEQLLPKKKSDHKIFEPIENISPKINKIPVKAKKDRKGRLDESFNDESTKENKVQKQSVKDETKKDIEYKENRKPSNAQNDDILRMMRVLKQDKDNVKKKSIPNKLPILDIPPLPDIETKKKLQVEVFEKDSGNIIECDVPYSHVPKKIIKNMSVFPYNPNYKSEKPPMLPLLFHVQDTCFEVEKLSTCSASSSVHKKTSDQAVGVDNSSGTDGIMFYALSNREFIVNGITRLPSMKTMRRMNIYKMEMAHKSWFENHKCLTKYYHTGEVSAIVDEQGFGQWFYKNGDVALEYYRSEEPATTCRYVVYSCKEDQGPAKLRLRTILAVFDTLGNGVVYDHDGNLRIKYNQSEGLVVDNKIGAPGRWMWHTLNEPPVIQHVFVDSVLKKRHPCLDKIKPKPSSPPLPEACDLESRAAMLAIELDNFVKERDFKALQEYRPFMIKSKAVKLNSYFGLKILDQANVRLIFRNGHTCLSLNVGMLLKSNEIIETESAEVTEVATPYDRRPARSKSLADIQYALERARKTSKQK